MRIPLFLTCLKPAYCLIFLISSLNTFALEVPVYDFPLDNYSQKVSDYFYDAEPDYNHPLLSKNYQNAQLTEFYRHYFNSGENGLSPWNQHYVSDILLTVKEMELAQIKNYDNEGKEFIDRHYGENFKAHETTWLKAIAKKMNISSLNYIKFNEKKRAIATSNTLARALPESSPDFLHFGIAGQGFPFDTLQESAIWLGTPLYVITTTLDKRWSLVITPDEYTAWIKSDDLAYTPASAVVFKNKNPSIVGLSNLV